MSDGRPIDAELLARLTEIASMEPTVDLTKRDSYVAAAGWNVDAREVALPPEQPGAPAPNASFAQARAILTAYSFPPPRLIRGRFDPSAPLDGRAMLLTATFLWMHFELPVRVSRVIDETRSGEHGAEAVWGYSYQTLAGHIERGEITFEIIKTLDTGAIRFRIHSFSQTGHIANPIHRIGFRIVGRRLQARFAVESLRNMQQQVTRALAVAGHDNTGGEHAP
ncbi:MAG: DUF1990 domain-containing protein [Gemmatimonadaceae bacterium]|nr:DUF1990 domain-containing protein [Gemmatimonadaceae bacterium]